MTVFPATLPVTLPELLARHVARSPEEPWLFHREAHGWGWHSWAQTACQVAAGAERLRAANPAGARVGCGEILRPRAVAAALAIHAAGLVAVPADGGEDAGAEVPAAPSRLDRWPVPAIVSAATPASPAFPGETHAQLAAAAERLDEVLALPAAPSRPIVVASPEVEPVLRHALLAWVLRRGAAWALEAEPGAFSATVAWTRPHVALAPGDELLVLAGALRALGGARRWRRLQRVVVTTGLGDLEVVADAWRDLGVPVAAWPGQALP